MEFFVGKVDDDCKDSLGDAKDSLSCADGSWPMMFKGTACSDVSVGDEITKPEKPTTKPCSTATDGDVRSYTSIQNSEILFLIFSFFPGGGHGI